MSFRDRTVAGILLIILLAFQVTCRFSAVDPRPGLLLFELDWSFHTTQTDTPVITIGTIPPNDVQGELILGVGRLRSLRFFVPESGVLSDDSVSS